MRRYLSKNPCCKCFWHGEHRGSHGVHTSPSRSFSLSFSLSLSLFRSLFLSLYLHSGVSPPVEGSSLPVLLAQVTRRVLLHERRTGAARALAPPIHRPRRRPTAAQPPCTSDVGWVLRRCEAPRTTVTRGGSR